MSKFVSRGRSTGNMNRPVDWVVARGLGPLPSRFGGASGWAKTLP